MNTTKTAWAVPTIANLETRNRELVTMLDNTELELAQLHIAHQQQTRTNHTLKQQLAAALAELEREKIARLELFEELYYASLGV